MKPAYKATLFGFAVAVVIYHVLTTAKAALAKVQGADTIEREFSDYDLAAELNWTPWPPGWRWRCRPRTWQVFRTLPLPELVAFLLTLAHTCAWRGLGNTRGARKSLRRSGAMIRNIPMSLPLGSLPLGSKHHVQRAALSA